MKKYISLIGALALGTTTSLTAVACGTSDNSNDAIQPPIAGTENIKTWSKQTSNIAKAFILSKNENFNTNRLVNNTLNNTANNILKNTDANTGSSYENFKNVWGYNKEIQGITEADFNNDTAQTIDNDQTASKQSIVDTLKTIKTPLGLIKGIFQDSNGLPNPKPNTDLNNLLTGPIKQVIVGTIGNFIFDSNGNKLKDSPIIETIKSLAPMVQTLANNLAGFNPEETLGDYYDDDIATALFEKNDGWLNNYQTFGGFSSEAVAQKSTILDNKAIFKTWDEVALFKTSIDLNGLIYQWSNGDLTLGQIFNNAIEYDKAGTAINFDINTFATQIQSIWSSSPENILNLITTLIPVIKTQLLGIDPTVAITKISTSEATNNEKGIINLTDIISIIEDNFLSKDGFTKFIADIFFSNTDESLKLGNYATLDFTCGTKTLSEVITPIQPQITEALGNLYTNSFEPLIQKFGIKNILNKVKEILAELKSEAGTAINLTDVQHIADILNNEGLSEFLTKLSGYKTKDELSADWENLWAILGLQDASNPNFKEDSVLHQVVQLISDNPNFFQNLLNLLDLAAPIIENSIDIIIASETTAKLDFNNETLWAINDATVTFSYNSKLDETTISYNLIDQTQTESKTYAVTVVVKGNADTALTDTKQVWLKALSPLK